MTYRHPSFAEADALAIALERAAREEQATVQALSHIKAGDPKPAAMRLHTLKRSAEIMRWVAGHATRLAELDTPKNFMTRR